MPCYVERFKDGGTLFLCGNMGPPCAACDASSGYLCDYPVGEEQSCDLPLCSSHAYAVAPNLHYCPGHLKLWEAFLNTGGVSSVLGNVVPFPKD